MITAYDGTGTFSLVTKDLDAEGVKRGDLRVEVKWKGSRRSRSNQPVGRTAYASRGLLLLLSWHTARKYQGDNGKGTVLPTTYHLSKVP